MLILTLQNEQGEKLGILAVVRSLNEMRRDLDTTRRNLADFRFCHLF